jgi:transcriptional regulator with XRE-family HTH domain
MSCKRFASHANALARTDCAAYRERGDLHAEQRMRSSCRPTPGAQPKPSAGTLVRAARTAQGLSLADVGARIGYSASQVSRYERGITPLTDITVLHRFSAALGIPPQRLGLGPPAPADRLRHAAFTERRTGDAHRNTVGHEPQREDGDMRRRQLLASLAITAASTVSPPAASPASDSPALGDLLIDRTRDALLGLTTTSFRSLSAAAVRDGLDSALADFRRCRYRHLADTLPRLISAGHQLAADGDTAETSGLVAEIYTLVTRMLIKLDDTQLGWMAADRARVLAAGASDPLLAAEAARNLAVLARKAGWHEQAMSLALTAAADPRLRGNAPRLMAERGLLIQSAAYTAARNGDRDVMRELTDEAAALAALFGTAVILRDHGGGFTPATVALHRISAENYAGDPGAAVAAAIRLPAVSLPTTERRARYWTDAARAYATAGRRDDSVQALLAAEREAPEETHARPAIRDLISGLLIGGRTGPELRGLAQRCGLTWPPPRDQRSLF